MTNDVRFHYTQTSLETNSIIDTFGGAVPAAFVNGIFVKCNAGFNAQQVDLSLRREFPIKERLRLQFRTDIFNITNHPNFSPPVGTLTNPSFGTANGLLGNALGATNATTGVTTGFSPLYQLGGPRSMQLALKLLF